MFEHTGCDAILTARATFGKPWLFEEIYQSLLGLQEDGVLSAGIPRRPFTALGIYYILQWKKSSFRFTPHWMLVFEK